MNKLIIIAIIILTISCKKDEEKLLGKWNNRTVYMDGVITSTTKDYIIFNKDNTYIKYTEYNNTTNNGTYDAIGGVIYYDGSNYGYNYQVERKKLRIYNMTVDGFYVDGEVIIEYIR